MSDIIVPSEDLFSSSFDDFMREDVENEKKDN